MGTTLNIDESLKQYFDISEDITYNLIKLLIKNYENNLLTLSITSKGLKYLYSSYRITESEFENIFLELRYNNMDGVGNLLEIYLEIDRLQAPKIIKIALEDEFLEMIPQEMKSNLEKHLYDEQRKSLLG